MLALYLTLLDEKEDKDLFEKLYYAYRKQMLSLAVGITRNYEEAEDVVHNVFLKIAQNNWSMVKSIKDKRDLRNYFLKATKNASLNAINKTKKETIAFNDALEYGLPECSVSDDEFINEICSKMGCEQIMEALQSLDENECEGYVKNDMIDFLKEKSPDVCRCYKCFRKAIDLGRVEFRDVANFIKEDANGKRNATYYDGDFTDNDFYVQRFTVATENATKKLIESFMAKQDFTLYTFVPDDSSYKLRLNYLKGYIQETYVPWDNLGGDLRERIEDELSTVAEI